MFRRAFHVEYNNIDKVGQAGLVHYAAVEFGANRLFASKFCAFVEDAELVQIATSLSSTSKIFQAVQFFSRFRNIFCKTCLA